MADTLHDGVYLGPVTTGPKRFHFPFLKNKDRVSCYFEEDYWQQVSTWTPAYLSTPHSAEYPDFYLVAESEPVEFMAGLCQFTRTWARVPADQVEFSTQTITKPQPSALGTNVDNIVTDRRGGLTTGVNIGPAYSYGAYLWADNVFYRLLSGTSTQTDPTGGTWTITYKTSTTAALAYNESAANIAAAINGLADIIADGITVTVDAALSATGAISITLAVGTTTTHFTADGSSLTPAESRTLFVMYSSTVQTVTVAGRITYASHGLTATDLFTNSSGNVVLFSSGLSWSIIDANTIAVLTTGAITFGSVVRAFTPGVDRVRTKRTTRFYLPGVTSGITTAADIPVPDNAVNDTVFLDLALANLTGFQPYDADPLSLWMGQIYQQPTIEIDMANV